MTSGSRAHSARELARRIALIAAIAGSPVSTLAQPTAPTPQSDQRPAAASRIVRLFDFEEPDNPHPVPEHWSRAQNDPNGPPSARREGFPYWNHAVFTDAEAVSGKHSVLVPTKGGSTCLRLDPGEIPIFPDADYTVSVRVKTIDLEHSRAFLTARLLDQRLRPIPDSEVRSDPILSPGGWSTATVIVTGRWANAAWLQIDLDLLQPEAFLPPPPQTIVEHAVVRSDVSGAALFDDVSVALLPRTRFWAQEPTGLFVAPQKVTLGMLARDQGGERLRARVLITDVDGRSVAQRTFTLDPSARPTMWSPDLPAFGWFRAVMDIDAGGEGDSSISVSRSELWFASLPEPLKLSPSALRNADFGRFGIAADSLSEPLLIKLLPLISRTRTRFVSLSAFDAAAPAEQAKADLARRTPLIERLLTLGQEITLVIGDVPAAIAGKETLDATDALGMVALDPTIWREFAEPPLDAFGQRIPRFQVGRTGDTHALGRDAAPALDGFERFASRLVPGPRLALPWRADYAFPIIDRPPGSDANSQPSPGGPLVDSMATTFPIGFPAEALAGLADGWRQRCASNGPFELTIVPELPDLAKFGPRARAVEAARRIAEFWRAMAADGDPKVGAAPTTASVPAPRLALNAPWKVAATGTGSAAGDFTLLPAPELGVTALMAERLAGRRVIAPIPAAAGVHAFLIAEHAGAPAASTIDGTGGEALVRACVVAWNDSAPADRSFVDVYPVNNSVTVVDTFGNASPLSASEFRGARAGPGVQVRVPLNDSPVFIEGVDPYLAQFTASIHLTPSFIPAIVTEHEHRIELTNPWPVRITGDIQLRDDSSALARVGGRPAPRSAPWKIDPNISEFAAAPGQTITLPVTISFGPGQIAGTKDLAIVAKVIADRPYSAIHAAATMEIGLTDLDLSAELQLSPTPTGPDVVVIAGVTNKDTHPRTLKLDVGAQSIATQTLGISDLPPGQTQFKQFVVRDGASTLAGRFIRVTLNDEETAARLSKVVLVPGK